MKITVAHLKRHYEYSEVSSLMMNRIKNDNPTVSDVEVSYGFEYLLADVVKTANESSSAPFFGSRQRMIDAVIKGIRGLASAKLVEKSPLTFV